MAAFRFRFNFRLLVREREWQGEDASATQSRLFGARILH